MTTLLVLTAGHTDVQIVVDGVRRELDKSRCGEVHDELQNRGFSIVDPPAQKAPPPLDTLPEGTLSVCTPKLDAVLRYLEAGLPTTALVFDTQRTTERDPRAAGAVMERRLAERGIRVRRHSFLIGQERLEDPSNDFDAVVRREVVERLASHIAREFDETKPERVIVATTGGLPAANEVVAELVRLHAVGRVHVDSLEVPDGAFTVRDDRAIPERFHPAAGYRARWQALSLIEKGNLLGAWGVASHLAGAPGQEWTRVVDWLARFASSLPIPASCDLGVLSHRRMAVRAALRVELALRAGDIPRSVQGTVAFLEAAVWDHILDHFERDPKDHRLLRLRSGATAPTGTLLRDGSKDDKERPFKSKQRNDGHLWFKFDDRAIERFASDYAKSSPLMALLGAVRKVKQLRNDVAHNEPTPALMEGARQHVQSVALWSTTDTFLSQRLVQDVLLELGEREPAKLLENLLVAVRKRIVTPSAVRPGTST